VVRLIQEEPAFKGTNGAFDVNTFRDTLRQAGLTEVKVAAARRSEV
jgi:peptidyl-prolyl cis-trans isomerase D